MEHVAPAHSTICRFRNALVEKKLWDKLLGMINKQLKSHEIMEIKRTDCLQLVLFISTNLCLNVIELLLFVLQTTENSLSCRLKEGVSVLITKMMCKYERGFDEDKVANA